MTWIVSAPYRQRSGFAKRDGARQQTRSRETDGPESRPTHEKVLLDEVVAVLLGEHGLPALELDIDGEAFGERWGMFSVQGVL